MALTPAERVLAGRLGLDADGLETLERGVCRAKIRAALQARSRAIRRERPFLVPTKGIVYEGGIYKIVQELDGRLQLAPVKGGRTTWVMIIDLADAEETALE